MPIQRSAIFALLVLLTTVASAQNEKPSNPPPPGAKTLRLVTGAPQVIYTDAQMPYTMDGSWATLALGGGRMMFFETAMALKPYYFRHSGTADNPLQKVEAPFVIDYNGYNHVWPSGCWINNIYRHGDGTLVGFCHREDLAPANGRKDGGKNYFIGLARSGDGGSHWIYLGDVIAPHGLQGMDPNIGGVPYLIVGPYVYLYFNEYESPPNPIRYLAVARARVDDMMKLIQVGRLPEFRKYSHGAWTEPGMTGLGSEIIPGSRGGGWTYDFHSDATYCKPLGCYLITVQTHAMNKLLLYTSADGLGWKLDRELDTAVGCMHPYSCFADFSSDAAIDGSEVGGKFYIYFPRKNLANYDDDTLCRIECSVRQP